MLKVVNFQDAIADSEEYSKRHLLLGNGFSIACCPDIFHYNSLFKQADFSSTPEAKRVFDAIGTKDFEVAIRALEVAAKLLPIYASDYCLPSNKMTEDAQYLKNLLVSTIAKHHPAGPYEIEESKFWACKKFLSYFIGRNNSKNGHVFTLNYDLLLYWTLMNEGDPFEKNQQVSLKKNDGFGNDEIDPLADYVVWQGETAAHSADVFFLHGALHLFDSGSELQKFTWTRSNERLVSQIQDSVNKNKFPLFVAEGTSKEKKNKIRHHAYLYQGLKTLSKNAQEAKHCFFIFGHSLAENDDHILLKLAKGKFGKLYIGLYGDSDDVNREIIKRSHVLKNERKDKFPLELMFFNSGSANVWGNTIKNKSYEK